MRGFSQKRSQNQTHTHTHTTQNAAALLNHHLMQVSPKQQRNYENTLRRARVPSHTRRSGSPQSPVVAVGRGRGGRGAGDRSFVCSDAAGADFSFVFILPSHKLLGLNPCSALAGGQLTLAAQQLLDIFCFSFCAWIHK